MLLIWEAAPSQWEVVRFDGVRSFTVEGNSEVTQHPLESGASATDHVFAKPKIITIEGLVTNTPLPSMGDPTIQDRFPGSVIIPTPPRSVMSERGSEIKVQAGPPGFQRQRVELNLPPKPLKYGNPLGQGISALQDLNSPRSATLGRETAPKDSAVTAQLWQMSSFGDRVRETYEALEKARGLARFVRVETGRIGDLENMLITAVTFPREAPESKALIRVSLEQVLIVASKTVDAPKPAEPLGQTKKAAGSKAVKPDAPAKDVQKKSVLSSLVDGAGPFFGNLFGGG